MFESYSPLNVECLRGDFLDIHDIQKYVLKGFTGDLFRNVVYFIGAKLSGE